MVRFLFIFIQIITFFGLIYWNIEIPTSARESTGLLYLIINTGVSIVILFNQQIEIDRAPGDGLGSLLVLTIKRKIKEEKKRLKSLDS